ncbi:MAG: hypothetical protein K6G88_10820 [Lachnospiraceae bacterium]|nr:hypothetical protein [Lachnospiraceae bacterium]
MKKRIICNLLLATIFTLNTTSNINAATKYAYSIGTDYGDNVDTSKDAKNAATSFGKLGYKSYYNTKPTVSYMKGNAPNGRRRLGCEIVFLSGHATSTYMSFNYRNKGGDYATGIIQGKDWESPSTHYKYAGVDDCDMSKTKLFVLAGCETARGGDNITKDIVQNGAKTALGWTTKISCASHSEWLKKFFTKLESKVRVIDAVNYANSFSYSDSNVKNTWIYGDTKNIVSLTDTKKSTYDERLTKCNSTLLVNNHMSESNLRSTLSMILLNSSVKIDLNNYKIKKHGTVIDLILMVDGCETNTGYTLIVENNRVKEIYNNEIHNNLMYGIIKKPIITDNLKKNKLEIEKTIVEKSGYTVISQESKLIYNVNNNSFEYYVFTDYRINDDGLLGRKEGRYEIK